ncbi:MAG: Triose-phosphate isomerase (Triosephosphate isomerase)-like protein [Ramlibacter sp.]|jgi:triosephosphate isomerase|nr:Triose-phosphate isomerase (Triosephosphate isomerase)-like protein [Ramlibacter sp.]
MTKKKLIAGNWKMNGTLEANDALMRALVAGMKQARCDVAVCVPAPYLAQVQMLRHGSTIDLGAQDVSAQEQGAYTGEVSAKMLREFGVRYAIVGHSERRQYHGESDALVADKAKAALANGITPIVCVGETLAEREAGQTADVVKRQLASVIHVNGHCISEIVVAYEPVWAIGTGKTATPEQAQEVHALLRKQLGAATAQAERVHILYGGSMNAANAASLLAQPDIDGGLIGGASLKAPDFLQIIAAASA